MRKKHLLFLLASMLLLAPVRADEGMWLLPFIEKLNIKTMKKMGFKLSAKDIYDINKSSLKDAIVHFGGGCTGEIISKEGLLLTNHHCGYGKIQELSTVENDYLQHGFWAMSKEQELPAPGLSVTFVESFIDITAEFEAAQRSLAENKSAISELNESLAKKYIGDKKFVNGNIHSMFGGNSHFYVVTKTFNDVRFVGAPPSSIGKYGADTDNWVWPRHTGDFSLFRVYADENNNPANYSPNNKPYTPKKHLTISLKGVKQNDFAMIIGFPGTTTRYMTAAEVAETRDIGNAIRIHARGVRQEVLMKEMVADPKIRLQYSNKYARSSNFWKKSLGMNETFAKNNVEERRAKEERAFIEWVNQDPARIEKYGKALETINNSVTERADNLYKKGYLSETLSNIEIVSAANSYFMLANLLASGDEEKIASQRKNLEDRIEKFYLDYSAPTDRKVTKAMIKVYKEKIDPKDRPSFYNEIDSKFNGDIDAYVDNIFDNSLFVCKEKADKIIANKDFKSMQDDPAVKLGSSISQLARGMGFGFAITPEAQKMAQAFKAYMAGILEMKKNAPLYPDANSTMRMTYGKVLNYSPKDAVLYENITTLTGVMEKEDPNNWEFVIPDKLKELYRTKDYGEYALPNGEVPVCFLTNNDITGGNSGSPVLNAKGELIGCAFDGNWEAMSGDVIFEPSLQRCINVDIRYVLFIIEKYGNAKHIVDEMTISK